MACLTLAAIAQALTLSASNAVRLYLVWRFVHIQPFNRKYARLAIPAIAGGLVMLGTHLALRHASWPVDLAASAALGGVVYGTVLLAAGLTPTERCTAPGWRLPPWVWSSASPSSASRRTGSGSGTRSAAARRRSSPTSLRLLGPPLR